MPSEPGFDSLERMQVLSALECHHLYALLFGKYFSSQEWSPELSSIGRVVDISLKWSSEDLCVWSNA